MEKMTNPDLAGSADTGCRVVRFVVTLRPPVVNSMTLNPWSLPIHRGLMA
jgi:hypothetical protein